MKGRFTSTKRRSEPADGEREESCDGEERNAGLHGFLGTERYPTFKGGPLYKLRRTILLLFGDYGRLGVRSVHQTAVTVARRVGQRSVRA